MKNVLMLVLAGALMLSGCKKDDDNNCDLSVANLAGSYKITSVLENGVETHNTSNYDPCELDDLIIFNTDGTYDYSDVGTVCSPSGDDGGTWSLSGNTLSIDGEDADVSQFTCSGLKVTFSYIDPTDPSLNYTSVITLQRP